MRLNVRQIAERFGVSEKTIYRWTGSNKIPHIRLGKRQIRFDLAKIDKWEEAHSFEMRK